jgi:hypothetical protein
VRVEEKNRMKTRVGIRERMKRKRMREEERMIKNRRKFVGSR